MILGEQYLSVQITRRNHLGPVGNCFLNVGYENVTLYIYIQRCLQKHLCDFWDMASTSFSTPSRGPLGPMVGVSVSHNDVAYIWYAEIWTTYFFIPTPGSISTSVALCRIDGLRNVRTNGCWALYTSCGMKCWLFTYRFQTNLLV